MIIKYQFKKLQAILEEGEGGGGWEFHAPIH